MMLIWLVNFGLVKRKNKMTKYIIIKYRSMLPVNATAHEDDSVFRTHTAVECDVEKKVYDSKEEAYPDLLKMQDYNPTVDYGLIEVNND